MRIGRSCVALNTCGENRLVRGTWGIDMLGLTLRWLLLPLMVAQPSDLSPTRAAIPHDDSGIGMNCLCVHLSGNSLGDRREKLLLVRGNCNENLVQHQIVNKDV